MKILKLIAIFIALVPSITYAEKLSYKDYNLRMDGSAFLLSLRERELKSKDLTQDEIIAKHCHKYRIWEQILITAAQNLQFDESLSIADQSVEALEELNDYFISKASTYKKMCPLK